MRCLRDFLILQGIRGIGKRTINKKYVTAMSQGASIEAVLSNRYSDEQIKAAAERAELVIEKLSAINDVKAITVLDEDYPAQLRVMEEKAPPLIYVKGNSGVLNQPGVAIVGMREPSEHSIKVEPRLVKKVLQLSDSAVIVSGLAIGCDTIAHATTVREHRNTVAVLPSGIEIVTPASNRKLAEAILETDGCLLSEYEPWTKANEFSFVERDSLIAAISQYVIAIEFSKNSGTMHTMNAAISYRRKIGCYSPKNCSLGLYEGNVEMIENKEAVALRDTEDLVSFLGSSVGEDKII